MLLLGEAARVLGAGELNAEVLKEMVDAESIM